MPSEIIQGIEIHWRDIKDGEEILYADLPQDEQYFRRIECPFTDEDKERLEEIDYEERPNHYTTIQKQYADKEEKRMTYKTGGAYAMINGKLTYIPPSYWAYLNTWTLEDGAKPEYREPDRIFCLFFEYLCFETDVRAITRGKARRIGATSLGFCLMWWICGREKEKKGGSISYNDTMADKNFKGMFMKGIQGMPICFLRDIDSKKAETFVRFRKNKAEGLQSYCDYLPTTINSYDSGRLSFGLFDEGGKYEKMDVNTFWSKASSTLRKGKKKVGFAYFPSTVNPKEKGGEHFEKFWKEADQNAINPKTGTAYGIKTKHKVVRYFVPATEGFAGCIDKFGNSVIEDPAAPIMGNDGEWITEGARTFILKERELKEGDQLMEHRRDYPLDEFDMFAFAVGNCEFNQERLMHRMRFLEEFPVFLRKGRLIEKSTTIKSLNPDKKDKTKREINFMDDEAGNWLIYEMPQKPNDFDDSGSYIYPRNMITYAAGVDTFRIGFAEDGSKGTICIFKKSAVVNGEETGCYPVAMYCGRPRLIQFLYDEIIKVCMWYGCKVNIEISAGDFYYGYFHEKGCPELMYWTPAKDPHNPKQKLKPGTETASPFELAAQLEAAKIYFDGDNAENYNGNVDRVVFPDLLKQALEYNHSERTPYDMLIAMMMALLPALRPQPFEKARKEKPIKILPQYKIKLPA